MIYSYRDRLPELAAGVFIAPSADIIGDVTIGTDSSIWFQVVIRGDVNWIRIGERTNIQDGSVIHVTGGTHPTWIGDDVTVGHQVTLHGCRIGHRCLIGMGAVVLDGTVVADEAMIAAGALVTPGTHVPSRTLYAGSPAKYKRDLNAEEIAGLKRSAEHYVVYGQNYRSALSSPA